MASVKGPVPTGKRSRVRFCVTAADWVRKERREVVHVLVECGDFQNPSLTPGLLAQAIDSGAVGHRPASLRVERFVEAGLQIQVDTVDVQETLRIHLPNDGHIAY